MSRRVLAFECQHCGAIKKTKKIADRHEITCIQNPEAKNCIFCTHSYNQEEVFPSGKKTLVCALRGVNCTRAISASCTEFRRKEAPVQK